MSADATAPPQHLGNYDVLSKIAEGGMGTVYKARHRVSGEIVAVKVIARTTARNPVLLQRFEREFIAAKVLDHPNVVRAIEYCGTGPDPFLVMEFVDGESVGQRIERIGVIPEAEAVALVAQVCEGLQRAHKQGLVHRDVKPDNILITREGVAKLTDMGLVKDAEGDLNLTKTGRGLGTPHYMAPEQFRNAKGVDVRGDIYSLGATLYAMVTGQIPFENASPLDCWMKKIRNEFPPPRELNANLSDRVDWAIRRAMSAEPDRRPSSCREFLEDLTGQSRMTPTRAAAVAAGAGDVWYLVYKDETGAAHTVKGSTEGIRKALHDNLLGEPTVILVSRTKTGQFFSLASVPEFRDFVVAPAALPTPGGPASGRYRREDGAVDVGAAPPPSSGASGVPSARSGRVPPQSGSYTPPPQSGRYAGQPAAPRSTPAQTPPTRRTPATMPTPTPADPKAETTLYVPPSARARAEKSRKGARPAKKSFDWTPVAVLVVMLISAAIGYVVLMR